MVTGRRLSLGHLGRLDCDSPVIEGDEIKNFKTIRAQIPAIGQQDLRATKHRQSLDTISQSSL